LGLSAFVVLADAIGIYLSCYTFDLQRYTFDWGDAHLCVTVWRPYKTGT